MQLVTFKRQKMKIVIIGGGNIGLAMTSLLSFSKNDVLLLTSKKIDRTLYLFDREENCEKKSLNFLFSTNKREALTNADLILCTYPAFLRKKFILEYGNYLKRNAILGFIPGYGGIEFSCKELLSRGIIIFGLQRVPFVSRVHNFKDKIQANILSKKKTLYLSSIPNHHGPFLSKIMENLLNIPCKTLNYFASLTLGTSNPLLHTVGVYNIFKNSNENTQFCKTIKLYESWTDEASELLLKYDEELQKICIALSGKSHFFNNLNREVMPLSLYYEAKTASQMTKKLKSIKAFDSVYAPLKQISDNKYVIDLDSRMFLEDFPFGVCVIKDISLIVGEDTPAIDTLINFYQKLTGYIYFNQDGSRGKDYFMLGAPGANGIRSVQELESFYLSRC